MAEVEPLIYDAGEAYPFRRRGSGDTLPAESIPDATGGTKGALSAADKAKLDAIPTGSQVPAGGATGEVLKKSSGADYDAAWAAESGGGGAGDVSGPASSTDMTVARFNGTTGKVVEEAGSAVINGSSDLSGIRNISLSGTLDGRDVAADGSKLDGIDAGATKNDDSSELTDVSTVSGATVKDALETLAADIAGLGGGLSFQGNYDLAGSAGPVDFPGSGSATTGQFWTAEDAHASGTTLGTTNQLTVFTGDNIVAQVPSASATDGADWGIIASTQTVSSVAGKTGAVTLAVADVSGAEDSSNKGAADGYASLDGTTKVPTAELGTGTASASNVLVGDRAWGQVPTAAIEDDAVTAAKLAALSVDGASIVPGSVGNTHLGTDAVSGAKVADLGIDAGKYAADSIDGNDIATGTFESIGGATGKEVYKGRSGGVYQFRKIQGGMLPADAGIDVVYETDDIHIQLQDLGIVKEKIAAGAVTTGKILDGAVTESKLSDSSVSNAKLADMTAGTVKGLGKLDATGAPVDLSAVEQRRIIGVEPASGARAYIAPFRVGPEEHTRIQRIRRRGRWIAGDATNTAELLNTHGTSGHSYPFRTFSAANSTGVPHNDHDRLANTGGADLVTSIEAQADVAGKAKFIRSTGDFTSEGYSSGKIVHASGFSLGATNGYWEIDSSGVTATTLTVLDPNDSIQNEAAEVSQEIRGLQSNASGFNGYEEGLLVLADSLRSEESIRFRAVGYIENPSDSDSFVEFVLEQNHVAGVHAGTRMLSGELGATWTSPLAFWWDCEFIQGYDSDEHYIKWSMRIPGILSKEGGVRVTGAVNMTTTDTLLCPRFRVDNIANIDTYGDPTYQGQGLRLELQRYDAGANC